MTSGRPQHAPEDGAPYGHDLGLAHDLSTLMGRRRALRLIAGAGLVTLVGCGSSKGSSSSSTTTGGTATTGSSTTSTTATSSTTGSTAATAATTAVSTTTTEAAVDADVSSAIPEETAGPYPGDGSNGPNALSQSGVVRSDIRSSFGTSSTVATGVPFTMKLRIVKVGTGAALAGAAVYVWHCDAAGLYSMYSQGATNENYLRGVQATDANGFVTFTSIFPACYMGRWPHVHFEVYPTLAAATGGSDPIATSQLALPEDACNAVYATSGYSQSVRNMSQVSLARDNVFSDGAARETPTVTGDATSGYVATLVVPVSA